MQHQSIREGWGKVATDGMCPPITSPTFRESDWIGNYLPVPISEAHTLYNVSDNLKKAKIMCAWRIQFLQFNITQFYAKFQSNFSASVNASRE